MRVGRIKLYFCRLAGNDFVFADDQLDRVLLVTYGDDLESPEVIHFLYGYGYALIGKRNELRPNAYLELARLVARELGQGG